MSLLNQFIIEKNDFYREYAEKNILFCGVISSIKSILIDSLSQVGKECSLIVANNDIEAREIYNELTGLNRNVLFFPSREIIFYSIDAVSHDYSKERINTLTNIVNENNIDIIVTSIKQIREYLVPKDIFKKSIMNIKIMDKVDSYELSRKLSQAGYERVEMVEGDGQFSIRGGIIDIFSPIFEQPFRIELFDDEVDSIRIFDIVSQTSIEKTDNILIAPANEFVFSDLDYEKLIDKLSKLNDKNEISTYESDLEKAMSERNFPGVQKYMPLVYENMNTIIDYIPKNTRIYLINPKKLDEKSESVDREYGEDITMYLERNLITLDITNHIENYNDTINKIRKRKYHIFVNIDATSSNFPEDEKIEIKSKEAENF